MREKIPCTDERDRYVCAAVTRRFAMRAGFDSNAAAELAVCAAELASNAVRHAGGGELELTLLEEPRGVELRCVDAGPGIADVEAALADGWSRGHVIDAEHPQHDGLGSGLGAIRRLSHALDIRSSPRGTTVIVRRLLEPSARR
ncbi:MAG: ATP-binding protein [Polyangiaceae bacterium]